MLLSQQRRSHYSNVFSNLTKNRKEAISKTVSYYAMHIIT